ncbi:hypothetical protein GE061_010138 [Apolygus lucorum]|uniref:Uncharacterized protein n=1 Tax=Apolygus lucorum TaxID=248454 RepID=A0A8S9Y4X0_APOLU|nr:hypothetical protein GE061_010138 [Apolygus lucorum]
MMTCALFGEITDLIFRRRHLEAGHIVEDEKTKKMVLGKLAEWKNVPSLKSLTSMSEWQVIEKRAIIYEIVFIANNGNKCKAYMMKTQMSNTIRYAHENYCYKEGETDLEPLSGEVVNDKATKEMVTKEVSSWKDTVVQQITNMTREVEKGANIYNIRYKNGKGETCDAQYTVEKIASDTIKTRIFECHKEVTQTKHINAILAKDKPLFGPNEHAEGEPF